MEALRIDKYIERLAKAGAEPAIGSVVDFYANALAEPPTASTGQGDPPARAMA